MQSSQFFRVCYFLLLTLGIFMVPVQATAQEEICDNGIDDNGNGLIDCEDSACDGFVNGPCDTGQPGICAAGTFVCQGGGQICVRDQEPGQEGPLGDPTCADGLDNNCNGLTDDADLVCQTVLEEICDNFIDDNGNGLIDCEDSACDGFVNGPCDTGQPGICAAGTFVCQGGGQICVRDQEPGQEGPFGDPTCEDGLDNDCDGLTDESDFDSCEPVNRSPVCDEASPSIATLWPPNHKFTDVQVLGVTDPDGDPVTITITSISQDELVDGQGDGRFVPDGIGVGSSIAQIRAERDGRGNGRVYHIVFTADDGMGGTCNNIVMVSVPHDQRGTPAVDEGPLYDSTSTP